MKRHLFYLIVVYALSITTAFPTEPTDCDDHCIKMTKRTEAEIETIISKIGDFIHSLIATHHQFDIKRVKFELEQHLLSDTEKEVVLEIAINDCGEEKKGEEVSEQTKAPTLTKQDKNLEKLAENIMEIIETNERNDIKQLPRIESEEKLSEQEIIDEYKKQDGVVKKPKKPELITLDFDDEGLDLLKKLDRQRGKKPLVVYIQQRGGQIEHTFLNR